MNSKAGPQTDHHSINTSGIAYDAFRRGTWAPPPKRSGNVCVAAAAVVISIYKHPQIPKRYEFRLQQACSYIAIRLIGCAV